VIYINPRKRRGKGRRRHRRNPGGVNVKHTFKLLVAGFAAGGAAAFLDKLLSGKSPMLANLAKVGVAVVVAAVGGRKYPAAAAAAVGALSGSVGYAMVTRMGGGIVAHTPAGAVKGLAEMSDDYPEMGALLQGGLGALLEGDDFDGLPSTVDNYETALQNMADGDDDND